MKDFFVIAGVPITAIVSVSGASPPPVAIWLQTAAKLHSQYFPPLVGFTLADVGN